MMSNKVEELLLDCLREYSSLGIPEQIDYPKFSIYSLITHSTAIEGSLVTELENQLLFDEGVTAKSRNIYELMMNLDLKQAYDYCLEIKDQLLWLTEDFLKSLAAIVMKNTGAQYKTAQGSFSAAAGDFRLLNVTAGFNGHSLCLIKKCRKKCRSFAFDSTKGGSLNVVKAYAMSFEAHFELVTIHPWADGNGRMARLLMNFLQFEQHLVPVKIKKEQKSEYIQALIDTKEQQDLNIFRQVMFSLHVQNIQQEIATYRNDLKTDFLP